MATRAMEQSKVVSPAEWLAARKQLLKKEKEFTRLRDELSRQFSTGLAERSRWAIFSAARAS